MERSRLQPFDESADDTVFFAFPLPRLQRLAKFFPVALQFGYPLLQLCETAGRQAPNVPARAFAGPGLGDDASDFVETESHRLRFLNERKSLEDRRIVEPVPGGRAGDWLDQTAVLVKAE